MSQAAAARILDLPQDFIPESELVKSDGVPLDSPRQRKQINLSIDVIEQAMAKQEYDDFYVGGNEFVYYSHEQARAIAREVRQLSLFPVPEEGRAAKDPPDRKHYKGPDVFVVKGGVEQREREVWASWLEGDRLPDFVFEIQSPSTAHVDAGEKRQLYADVFKSREYLYYGPDDPDLGKYRDVLVGLRLDARGVYAPIDPDERGWIWSEVLGVYVGRWDGVYDNRDDRWIRLYDAQGRLIPTGKEAERQQKEAERQQKEVAEKRADEERQLRKAERRKREAAEKRAETERLQKEAERLQKEAAEKRAEAAEAEVGRLKKLLESGSS